MTDLDGQLVDVSDETLALLRINLLLFAEMQQLVATRLQLIREERDLIAESERLLEQCYTASLPYSVW